MDRKEIVKELCTLYRLKAERKEWERNRLPPFREWMQFDGIGDLIKKLEHEFVASLAN